MPVNSVPRQSAVNAGGGGPQVEVVQQGIARLSLSTTPTPLQERLSIAVEKAAFRSLPLLGQGDHARVRRLSFNGEDYAVKVSSFLLSSEIWVANSLANRPELRGLPEFVWAGFVSTSGRRRKAVVMRPIEGMDLHKAIKQQNGHGSFSLSLYHNREILSEEEKRHRLYCLQKLARDISAAIYELDCLGCMHRNINPYNIRVSHMEDIAKIKFTLLGFRLILDKPDTGSADSFTESFTPCGHVDYLSPEAITRCYDQKVDIWSFGMTLHKVVTGGLPIIRNGKEGKLAFYKGEELKLLEEILPGSLVDLINSCLKEDPKDRLSIDEVRAHPFLTEDLLSEDSAAASAYA